MVVDPIFFSFFGINLYWYGLVYAIGFLFTLMFVKKALQLTGFNSKKIDQIENSLILAMVFGVIGGRIFHILFYEPSYYFSNLGEIIRFDKGGMSIHGGILFSALSLYFSSKKYKFDFFKLTDILVLPFSLVLAFGRIANFINQELVGKVTDSFLGVKFIGYEELRYPSQLFESLKNLIVFEMLLYLYVFKKFKTGVISALFLILYNGLRFFVDFTREVEVNLGLISMGQALSLTGMFLGLVMLYLIQKKKA